ncbi:PID-CTERM protein-sorting domain-containing protein, partial [Lutibacter litoralis]|uniref:PID-CTERM protein-sorting domain-containing protein n=1 Tax=Lutibacter litoralis TaxID=321268 RepID=A0ABV5K1A8_9FLAO
MRNKIIKHILFVAFLLMFNNVLAQDPPIPDDQAPELPVDGGISFLLAVGALYGTYKLKRSK